MKFSAVVATDNFGDPPVKKIAKRKSFHADVNCQMRTTTKPGIESGKKMVRKIRTIPAPSTRAASISSLGIAA